jgi:hypothetical protein
LTACLIKLSATSLLCKKNLSITHWLNALAIENNINFSNLLQKALMQELNVSAR